ncbi:c-type cytochrome [Methylobacterium sp. 391_Methyba4]|uniref:c-type cytochrome n=1 Tax=Methylobacterium sp. 391_Methyba4 TaxID=3038924 RepID=UPI00241F1185|nr:c-type cytochrome [Methylobacterium sp. 391_Methyba4]WFS05363.1 c-type cytochrome [Methylobacterium sp. 391_Methyba4]
MNPIMRFTGRSAACLALATVMGGLAALTPLGPVGAETTAPPFVPQPNSVIPDDDFGQVIRLGERIFRDTGAEARAFVGNDLRCTNCHLDRGRLGHSAPLWAAYLVYPAYRAKNGHVNTFAERLQGCFRYSMNGKAPPLGDPVLVALETYAAFLAHGAPVGMKLPGQGYPKLAKPQGLDRAHGREVYAAKCALCHGGDGAGQASPDGTVVFPPLWGARSYNWGAGMSSVVNAAGFIKANMPLSQGNSLTDAEAWDVAAYIDSRERPQDPRFTGDLAATRKAHHDSPYDFYGQTVDGVTLGEAAPPAGTVPR